MVAEPYSRKVVRVPDVASRPLEKARILLEDAALGKIVVLFRESYEDLDTVLEQRPSRGQMVYEGTEVTLWVARRGYLEHLPAIYRRSDAVGRNIVRDMCFLFEHMFGSIESCSTTAIASSIRTSARPSSSPGSPSGPRWSSTWTGPRPRSAR